MAAPGGAVRFRGEDDRDAACLHHGRTHRAEQLAGKAAAAPAADND